MVPKSKELYPHQKEGVRRALQEPFFALFMEQGTGKTAVAIRTLVERYRKGEAHRALVFAPNNLLYNWTLEIGEWADLPQDELQVLRLRGKGKARWVAQIEEFLKNDYGLLTLKQLESLGLKGKKTKLVSEHRPPLMIMLLNYEKASILESTIKKFKVQSLIVDESQRIKGKNTQTAKAIYRLTRRCSSRLLMTGTPVGNGYEDLFMQYKVMDPTILGENYKAFENQFIQKGGYMGKEIVGYQNLEKLKSIVANTSYRVELDDCVELPPLDLRYLTCELSGASQKAYDELYEDLYTQIPLKASRGRLKAILRQNGIEYRKDESYLSLLLKAEPFLNVASCDLTITKLLRLHQLTGGFLKLDSGEIVQYGREKLDLTIEYLKARKLPTVVFCNFVEEIKTLEKELKRALPNKRIENYRDSKNREKVEADFRSGKVDIIILQVHSGSTGLNLQAANAVLFYSTSYSADDYWQAISRIKRPGQRNQMEVVVLMCEGTIDEDIARSLKTKSKRMKELWRS